jgi:hypothetical protein
LAGWIAGLTEKTAPAPNDWLLIEDSEAGNKKRKAKLGTAIAATGARDIQLTTIKDETTPWIKFGQTTYAGLAFIFQGTTILGDPSKIEVIARAKDPGKTGDLRVFDVDNNKVICELIGISNNTFQILDLGDLDNLPSSKTIWEIQGRKAASSGTEIQIQFVHIEF